MGTGLGMAEKGADLVGSFGRENVLELASLLLDFELAVERQAVGKQALGQTVPADDVGGALPSTSRQFDHDAAIADRNPGGFQRVMTRIHEALVIVGFGWMRASKYQSHVSHLVNRQAHGQSTMNFHVLYFCDLFMLFEDPEFLEHLFELLLVGHTKDFLGGDLAVM